MRVAGWLLLIVGIVFEVLFAFAALGGSDVPVAAYASGGFLIVMGWQLRTFGRGLVERRVAAGNAAPTSSGSPTRDGSPTIELPLTPATASLIAQERGRSRRVLLIVIGALDAAFLALGVGLDLLIRPPEGAVFTAIMLAIGLGFSAITGIIVYFSLERPVRRDVRASTYLRTSGPIQLISISGGHMLRLADRAFLLSGRSGAKELAKLDWATVDHAQYSHTILEIRDRSGASVYCLPGYQPPASAAT